MTKVWAVGFATFKEAAAALIVRCSSSASATRRRLPFGGSGALRCCIRVLLEVVGVEHPQPLGGPGSTSRRSERGEARHLEAGRRSRAHAGPPCPVAPSAPASPSPLPAVR